MLFNRQPRGKQSVDRAMTTATIGTGETGLVERARMGDHEAFAALVDGRLDPTFRTALAILGHEADARDATQEIFLRAWRSLPELRDPDRFEAWFGRIVVNTCRSALRGRGRQRIREIHVSALPAEGDGLLPVTRGPDQGTADLDELERAMARLSADELTLLELHHRQGLDLERIGELLNIPAKTVKSRLFSARRALERSLEVEAR
jgi:RNA polymerase sigma-70 factor, ECF subfamily